MEQAEEASSSQDRHDYQDHVKQGLKALTPVFAQASIGDFSTDVVAPVKEDEFAELYTGVQIMLEVVREKIAESKEANQKLTNSLQQIEENKDAIEHEKAQLEAILDGIGEGLMVIRKDNIIILMNNAALQMLQLSLTDVIGKRWHEVLKVRDFEGKEIPMEKRTVFRVLTTGGRVSTMLSYRRGDGSYFPATLTSSPVLLAGSVVGVVNVFRDITRQREIDRAKSEFVSIASHQLGTPLSTLRWYIEVMRDGGASLSDEQNECLKEMELTTKRMINLVDDLLSVSRLEIGSSKYAPGSYNVTEVIRDVLNELKPQLEDKMIKVTEQYIENLPLAHFDPIHMRVIVQNVLSNAVKYNRKEGAIIIDVRKGRGDSTPPASPQSPEKTDVEGGSGILISVSDTGFGIPHHQQFRVFSKFFRGDNAHELHTHGSGLGMYIVKTMIQQGGGDIWFVSDEGKGSTFTIFVPSYAHKKRLHKMP